MMNERGQTQGSEVRQRSFLKRKCNGTAACRSSGKHLYGYFQWLRIQHVAGQPVGAELSAVQAAPECTTCNMVSGQKQATVSHKATLKETSSDENCRTVNSNDLL